MQINKLKINDLRNHHHTELELGPGINHFYGLNGSGKTTILEAISILSFSKTFLPTNDQSIIRFGQNSYHISCEARTSLDVPYKASLSYETGKKKKINSTPQKKEQVLSTRQTKGSVYSSISTSSPTSTLPSLSPPKSA